MSKIIFITGTSTGFGKLTAITLAKAGNQVLAGMRDTREKNAAVAEELSKLPNIEVVDIDISSDASVELAFAGVLAKYGRIDVLVNNAGVTGAGLFEGYSIDQIRKMFEINFYGVVRTYQAVLPSMRKEKNGLIINLTSGASGHTPPFMVAYMASKMGVESITEGVQDEVKGFGIENVSIQPGVYPTEMNNGSKAGLPPDRPERVAEYGEAFAEAFKNRGKGIAAKIQKFDMNPQTIADGILKLVNMEKGTRPLRFPLDAIAEGTDQEFIDARAEIKARWIIKYGS